MPSPLDLDFLIPALKKSIGGGCHTPTLRPVYTAHGRIQMPRVLTEDEQVLLQVELDMLPCDCTFTLSEGGTTHILNFYRYYQGG